MTINPIWHNCSGSSSAATSFRTRRSERMWKMEGLFAEAKQNHGLSRARYRGRSKVQIQAYLSAIVQNLKRLVAALVLADHAIPKTPSTTSPQPPLLPKSRLIQQARSLDGVPEKRLEFLRN